MPYMIGVDIGTSGTKALLIDDAGTVIAASTSEYPLFMPQPLWSEQNPEDWWKATRSSIRAILERSHISPKEIVAIGLTGQMHGLVTLDRQGKVIRPCIMWNDQRTALECEEITSRLGFAHLLALTANPVLPGFTAPKILWMKKNEPTLYNRIEHILLPKDFIRYKLTGDFATDVSDASGMSLLDVKARRWSQEMLDLLGIPLRWLPKVYESVEVTGKLSPEAASLTGLCPGTPVVAGGGDQAAGAVGSGIVKPGIVSVTLGTSGVVFAHADRLSVEKEGKLHAFCHAVPGAWHVMGVTLAAGGSLRWLRDTLGTEEKESARIKGVDPYDILLEHASQVPAGSEGLYFLPYLSGERTPYPDPLARGAFIGLTTRHTKAHMVRSVLEGVAFSLRDCLELIKNMGFPVQCVVASGGGARSPLWRQILADAFATELITVTSTEGAPYGAALLAGVGAGIFSDVQSACARAISPSIRVAPAPANVLRYAEYYRVYRTLYPTLKPVFPTLR